ncbi:MAG TPA: terminase [Terracidiphilus sp.]|jgi:hypothetical protein|nr:terminase [Terracidiphilus sp.]
MGIEEESRAEEASAAGTQVEAQEAGLSLLRPEELDCAEMLRLGFILDRKPLSLCGRNVLTEMAAVLLRFRDRDGGLHPLRANAAQSAFERRRGSSNIVLKARQMGITTWVAARFFLKTITHPGTLTLEVADTQGAAQEIFSIVHRFLDCMPESLRSGLLRTSRSNVRTIVFPEIDAQYLVVSAGERNAGRGLTVQNLHCSELARWPGNAAETLAGLRAALAPRGEMVLESTPDGIGGCFYEEWQRAAETGMVQHFFHWWLEAQHRRGAVAESSLTEEERALVRRQGLDLEQIGFRRSVWRESRGLAAQEYAEDSESCFMTSGDSVFETTAVEERLATSPAPLQARHNGQLEIWLPPLKGKVYLVAVDPAGGGSEGDYSAAQVLDLETGLQCAEFAGHVGGAELARLVTGLAEEYNHAWLVVERNNQGSGILALIKELCHYGRIYEHRGIPGWPTDRINRPAMLSRLDAALVENPGLFQSRKMLAECRCFVRFRNGKTGARAGTHDDRVMAMVIGMSARDELLLTKKQ